MRGLENTDAQVEHALRMTRWALRECQATGDDRVLGAFRLLGARGCTGVLPGEQGRLATFRRLRARLP